MYNNNSRISALLKTNGTFYINNETCNSHVKCRLHTQSMVVHGSGNPWQSCSDLNNYIINARPTFMPCMYFLNWTTSVFSCMFDDVYLKETVQYRSPILAFPRPHLPHRPLFICFFVLVSLCYPCMHTRALPAASTDKQRELPPIQE